MGVLVGRIGVGGNGSANGELMVPAGRLWSLPERSREAGMVNPELCH